MTISIKPETCLHSRDDLVFYQLYEILGWLTGTWGVLKRLLFAVLKLYFPVECFLAESVIFKFFTQNTIFVNEQIRKKSREPNLTTHVVIHKPAAWNK